MSKKHRDSGKREDPRIRCASYASAGVFFRDALAVVTSWRHCVKLGQGLVVRGSAAQFGRDKATSGMDDGMDLILGESRLSKFD